MDADVIIIGAGIAGLICARELTDQGRRVIVLEKSRGLGGRCATRRVDGQPVDHGVTFFHGSDPSLLEALRGIPGAAPLEGWPRRIDGTGRPCQKRAFDSRETRLSFSEGINVFPRHLARELAVRRRTLVSSVGLVHGGIGVTQDDGGQLQATTVVLALPPAQAAALLEPLAAASKPVASIRHLLGRVGIVRCLSLLAGYDRDAAAPGWDMSYPEDSRVLQLISHESSKRRNTTDTLLVYQALPCWSRLNWDSADATWGATILNEAARLFGSGFGTPRWTQTHRWKFARTDGCTEFSVPVVVEMDGGATLGLAGEAFHPGGGVQAAWQSGVELARRLAGVTT